MVSFYAVQGGRRSGIFTSRDRVLDATVGYPGAKINTFSTLAKAEQFMKEGLVTSTQTPTRWSGPAYAVAVGRRMGIFRDHAAALRQTFCYSANSMKKFASFEEAMEFLDRHNWRTITFNEGDGVEIVDGVDGNSDAGSSAPTTEEEDSPDAGSPEFIGKHERAVDHPGEENATSHPAQRRKIDHGSTRLAGNDLTAFCCGSLASDSDGRQVVKSTCYFPAHSEWNVIHFLHEPNCTITQAGLTAALEALKRATQRDPVCELHVTIFTVNQPVYQILRNEVECEEHHDLLQTIAKELSSREIRVLYVGDVLRCADESSP